MRGIKYGCAGKGMEGAVKTTSHERTVITAIVYGSKRQHKFEVFRLICLRNIFGVKTGG